MLDESFVEGTLEFGIELKLVGWAFSLTVIILGRVSQRRRFEKLVEK